MKDEIKDYHKRALESGAQPEMDIRGFFLERYSFCLCIGHAGSSLLVGLSLVASGGYSLVAVPGLLIAMTLLVPEHRLQGMWAQ